MWRQGPGFPASLPSVGSALDASKDARGAAGVLLPSLVLLALLGCGFGVFWFLGTGNTWKHGSSIAGTGQEGGREVRARGMGRAVTGKLCIFRTSFIPSRVLNIILIF